MAARILFSAWALVQLCLVQPVWAQTGDGSIEWTNDNWDEVRMGETFELTWNGEGDRYRIDFEVADDPSNYTILTEEATGNNWVVDVPVVAPGDYKFWLIVKEGFGLDNTTRSPAFSVPDPNEPTETETETTASETATTETDLPTQTETETTTGTGEPTSSDTATETPDPSSGGGLSSGAKAGIGVGASLGGIALIAAVGWFFFRKGRASGQAQVNGGGAGGHYNAVQPPPGMYGPPPPGSEMDHRRMTNYSYAGGGGVWTPMENQPKTGSPPMVEEHHQMYQQQYPQQYQPVPNQQPMHSPMPQQQYDPQMQPQQQYDPSAQQQPQQQQQYAQTNQPTNYAPQVPWGSRPAAELN